jgi:hypothetical protein
MSACTIKEGTAHQGAGQRVVKALALKVSRKEGNVARQDAVSKEEASASKGFARKGTPARQGAVVKRAVKAPALSCTEGHAQLRSHLPVRSAHHKTAPKSRVRRKDLASSVSCVFSVSAASALPHHTQMQKNSPNDL